ncbi:hypothetical protein [Rhodococcus sp. WAY2]|nr:hypothetical protein [Rhodococcus sp. WAY2]QHE72675.1 hypothetical protein GFS60_06320 [Rhodococcus sp. WAY2]
MITTRQPPRPHTVSPGTISAAVTALTLMVGGVGAALLHLI